MRGCIDDPQIASAFSASLVKWSHAEFLIVPIFGRLLGLAPSELDTARLLFYALVNQRTRLQVMRDLLGRSRSNRNKGPEYDALLDDFDRLNTLRNRYVHGLWWSGDSGKVYIQIDSSDYEPATRYRRVTFKELNAFLARIDKLMLDAMAL